MSTLQRGATTQVLNNTLTNGATSSSQSSSQSSSATVSAQSARNSIIQRALNRREMLLTEPPEPGLFDPAFIAIGEISIKLEHDEEAAIKSIQSDLWADHWFCIHLIDLFFERRMEMNVLDFIDPSLWENEFFCAQIAKRCALGMDVRLMKKIKTEVWKEEDVWYAFLMIFHGRHPINPNAANNAKAVIIMAQAIHVIPWMTRANYSHVATVFDDNAIHILILSYIPANHIKKALFFVETLSLAKSEIEKKAVVESVRNDMLSNEDLFMGAYNIIKSEERDLLAGCIREDVRSDPQKCIALIHRCDREKRVDLLRFFDYRVWFSSVFVKQAIDNLPDSDLAIFPSKIPSRLWTDQSFIDIIISVSGPAPTTEDDSPRVERPVWHNNDFAFALLALCQYKGLILALLDRCKEKAPLINRIDQALWRDGEFCLSATASCQSSKEALNLLIDKFSAMLWRDFEFALSVVGSCKSSDNSTRIAVFGKVDALLWQNETFSSRLLDLVNDNDRDYLHKKVENNIYWWISYAAKLIKYTKAEFQDRVLFTDYINPQKWKSAEFSQEAIQRLSDRDQKTRLQIIQSVGIELWKNAQFCSQALRFCNEVDITLVLMKCTPTAWQLADFCVSAIKAHSKLYDEKRREIISNINPVVWGDSVFAIGAVKYCNPRDMGDIMKKLDMIVWKDSKFCTQSILSTNAYTDKFRTAVIDSVDSELWKNAEFSTQAMGECNLSDRSLLIEKIDRGVWDNVAFCKSVISKAKEEDRQALSILVGPGVWKDSEFCLDILGMAKGSLTVASIMSHLGQDLLKDRKFCINAITRVKGDDKAVVAASVDATLWGEKEFCTRVAVDIQGLHDKQIVLRRFKKDLWSDADFIRQLVAQCARMIPSIIDQSDPKLRKRADFWSALIKSAREEQVLLIPLVHEDVWTEKDSDGYYHLFSELENDGVGTETIVSCLPNDKWRTKEFCLAILSTRTRSDDHALVLPKIHPLLWMDPIFCIDMYRFSTSAKAYIPKVWLDYKPFLANMMLIRPDVAKEENPESDVERNVALFGWACRGLLDKTNQVLIKK